MDTQLPLDLPIEILHEHSIRSIGKQKIKNIEITAVPSIPSSLEGGRKGAQLAEYTPRALQIMQRYGSSPEIIYRNKSRSLSQEEKKREDGAWSTKVWEEKFYQLLLFRRFIPHPVLYAFSEIEYPVTWTFIPNAQQSSYFNILEIWQKERAFAGAQIYLGRMGNAQALPALEMFYEAIDFVYTKQAKPYPAIRAILPAHFSDLSEFILKAKAGKKQCYRGHFVEFTEGFLGKELVYEPILREIWRAYREGFCIEGIYGKSFLDVGFSNNPERVFLGKDKPCIGTFNLAQFFHEGKNEILWEELTNSLQTVFRFLDDWMYTKEKSVILPWLGIIGWRQEFSMNFFSILEEVQSKRTKKIAVVPSYSKFFHQIAGLVNTMQVTREGILEEIRAQELFYKDLNKGNALAAIRGIDKLEFEDFTFVVTEALKAGWLGVRFV